MNETKKEYHRTHRTKGSPAKGISNGYTLVLDKDLSPSYAESYRTLHTNVHYSFNGKPGGLVLITSSMPQEGKTTTAVNLAITMAESGQKVLLIDTDLRAPSVYKAFNHDRKRGLTNILIDVYSTNLG